MHGMNTCISYLIPGLVLCGKHASS